MSIRLKWVGAYLSAKEITEEETIGCTFNFDKYQRTGVSNQVVSFIKNGEEVKALNFQECERELTPDGGEWSPFDNILEFETFLNEGLKKIGVEVLQQEGSLINVRKKYRTEKFEIEPYLETTSNSILFDPIQITHTAPYQTSILKSLFFSFFTGQNFLQYDFKILIFDTIIDLSFFDYNSMPFTFSPSSLNGLVWAKEIKAFDYQELDLDGTQYVASLTNINLPIKDVQGDGTMYIVVITRNGGSLDENGNNTFSMSLTFEQN